VRCKRLANDVLTMLVGLHGLSHGDQAR